MLAQIQSVEKSVAILSYNDTVKVNSICHPIHVPDDHNEFKHYFPHTWNNAGQMVIKCRMTSSTSIAEIK